MTSRPRDLRKKHVATGRPKGGARPGAGRPPGPNALPMGAVKALKTLNLRVPSDATDNQRALLAGTEDAIVRVMQGKVHGSIAGHVLLAARTVREEICGPIAKQVNVQASVGLAAMLDEVAVIEGEATEVKSLPPAPVVAKGPIVRKGAASAIVTAAVAGALDESED